MFLTGFLFVSIPLMYFIPSPYNAKCYIFKVLCPVVLISATEKNKRGEIYCICFTKFNFKNWQRQLGDFPFCKKETEISLKNNNYNVVQNMLTKSWT